MSYAYVYKDYSSYCEQFQQAIALLEKDQYAQAIKYFQLAYESVLNSDVYHNKYASFCGLLRVIQGDYGGLHLCRDAARNEYFDGDVFLNLARAEWSLKNRKKTVAAILDGLSIDETHPGLQQMQQELGVRRRNPLPGLSRNNRLNVMLGRILRKR